MTLPTMTSLRVVLALAQHGTVSAAARGLHLTQSAVSKQLKAIEAIAGVRLFERKRHGLVPTEAGMIYIEQGRIAIGAMETAALRTARLRRPAAVVRLHVLPILGDRWFLPRLPEFSERFPDIDVQFVTFAPREAFRDVDVAFRFGEGPWPGWRADYFLGREVILVGAPNLIAREGGIVQAEDVRRFRLLEHPQTPLHWDDFLAAVGIEGASPTRRAPFGYYALVIRAAISGQGLALVPRSLVASELQSGELVNPLGLGFQSRNCYWLTTPDDRPRDGHLRLFCDWALSEATRFEARSADAPARRGRSGRGKA